MLFIRSIYNVLSRKASRWLAIQTSLAFTMWFRSRTNILHMCACNDENKLLRFVLKWSSYRFKMLWINFWCALREFGQFSRAVLALMHLTNDKWVCVCVRRGCRNKRRWIFDVFLYAICGIVEALLSLVRLSVLTFFLTWSIWAWSKKILSKSISCLHKTSTC